MVLHKDTIYEFFFVLNFSNCLVDYSGGGGGAMKGGGGCCDPRENKKKKMRFD